MKIYKRILSIFLSIVIIFLSLTLNVKNVYAENEPVGFYVSSIEISGNTYSCYEYYHPASLSTGFEIYWALNGKVCHCPMSDYLRVLLNKKIGLVFNQTWFTNFISFFYASITALPLETLEISPVNIFSKLLEAAVIEA